MKSSAWLAELLGLGVELGERLGQAVRDGDLGALEGADELGLVVARHAQRVAGGDHAHDQAEHAGGVRAAVDEVADEHGLPAFGVGGSTRGVAVVVDRSSPARSAGCAARRRSRGRRR